MIELDVTVISVLIALISVLVAVASFISARKDKGIDSFKDMQESLLKANMKLDQVCATTTETRSDIKSMNTKISTLEKDMGVFEQKLQNLSKEVDKIKEEMEG